MESAGHLPCSGGDALMSSACCKMIDISVYAQVYLQLQEPQHGQMKALKANLEKARELKSAQSNGGGPGGVDKGQQQMIMELYQKCAQLKVQ